MGFDVRRLALAPHKVDIVDLVDLVDARNAEPADRHLAEIPTSGMLFFGKEPLSSWYVLGENLNSGWCHSRSRKFGVPFQPLAPRP